jgi:1-acyl-sn-glycerol-3-phosphate acyltransferase
LLQRLFYWSQCLMLFPVTRTLFRVRATGAKLPRPAGVGLIVAPNHASWIDPFVVQQAVFPQRLTFLMTELYFDLPVAGLYFRAAGARPIRESGPSVAGLRAATEALGQGEVVCLFPEGEITRDGLLGRGRRGVARLARRTGAPVVPVGVRGTLSIWSRLQRIPRLGSVEIRIGAPLRYDEPDEGREGERRFTDRLMAEIRRLSED